MVQYGGLLMSVTVFFPNDNASFLANTKSELQILHCSDLKLWTLGNCLVKGSTLEFTCIFTFDIFQTRLTRCLIPLCGL